MDVELNVFTSQKSIVFVLQYFGLITIDRDLPCLFFLMNLYYGVNHPPLDFYLLIENFLRVPHTFTLLSKLLTSYFMTSYLFL